MPISRKDKKLIFNYFMEAPNGLPFGKILKPDPKPVRDGGVVSVKSVREVDANEEQLFEYWEELKRTGVIRAVDRLNPDLYVLTNRGKKFAELEDYDLSSPSLDIK